MSRYQWNEICNQTDHRFSGVESTVTGEQITIDSVRDLATCRKCMVHLVVTNRSQTISDLFHRLLPFPNLSIECTDTNLRF